MNTPPGQITRPRTPSTPRHGARFGLESPTRKQPSRATKSTYSASNYTSSTLSPPPSSPIAASPSPRRSPRMQKKARFALDEDVVSEEERTESRPTLLNQGGFGLATPAKTPRKKKLPAGDVAQSARSLFSSSKSTSTTQTKTTTRTVNSSLDTDLPPRTPVRKNVKRDLFGAVARTPKRRPSSTLEVDDLEAEEDIQIFTDSDARRPKKDVEENPFNTRSSTRNKRAHKPLGKEQHREDGMYYVFRGKRVFKYFNNLPDNEDRAGGEDNEGGLNPAAIKPRLLFPTRSSRRLEAENIPADAIADNTVAEEEAETDIDEASQSQASNIVISNTPKKAAASSKRKPAAKRNVSRLTPDSDDDEIIPKSSVFATPAKKNGSNSKPRMSASKALFDEDEDGDFILPSRKLLFEEEEIDVPRPTTSKGKKRALECPDTPARTPRRRRIAHDNPF